MLAVLLLLLVGAISAGCVSSVPEPVLIREPRPDPIPLRIGVYYSPEFQSFTYGHDSFDFAWILGKPSVQLLHEALALLFIEVVEVPRPGSEPGLRGDLAGVIEPRIVSAVADHVYEEHIKAGVMVEPVRVTYGFVLYSPRRELVASWYVTGRGSEPFHPTCFLPTCLLTIMSELKSTTKRNLEHAMREAAWEFTSGFRDIPEVRRWLAEQASRKD
jgi:hypothetical protein